MKACHFSKQKESNISQTSLPITWDTMDTSKVYFKCNDPWQITESTDHRLTLQSMKLMGPMSIDLLLTPCPISHSEDFTRYVPILFTTWMAHGILILRGFDSQTTDADLKIRLSCAILNDNELMMKEGNTLGIF